MYVLTDMDKRAPLHDAHMHVGMLNTDPLRDLFYLGDRGIHAMLVTEHPERVWEVGGLLNGDPVNPATCRLRLGAGLHPLVISWKEEDMGGFGGLKRIVRGWLSEYDEALQRADFIGEVGIDGERPSASDARECQELAFAHVLDTIPPHRTPMIVSIHSRRAPVPVLRMLEERPYCGAIPVLHWWTGSPSQTRRAVERGCWFSINPGMMRNSAAATLRRAEIPLGVMVLETDYPYRRRDQHKDLLFTVERLAAERMNGNVAAMRYELAKNYGRLWAQCEWQRIREGVPQ